MNRLLSIVLCFGCLLLGNEALADEPAGSPEAGSEDKPIAAPMNETGDESPEVRVVHLPGGALRYEFTKPLTLLGKVHRPGVILLLERNAAELGDLPLETTLIPKIEQSVQGPPF